MKVLSLFDGMACGMIAMNLAGVDVESYDAYEIDKYAVKTAQHNFPMIREHGDVFAADFTQYEGVDFMVGGSPCTYWSIAQTKNRETVASGMGWELFSQYVRALHEANPKYFIYENNKSMSKDIRASIDKAFGFEAVLINSALVSAQNRQRLYWVGRRNEDGTYSKVKCQQPADRGILLKDILDSVVAWNTIERHQRNMVAERVPEYSSDKSRPLSASYAHKGDGEGSLKCDAFPDNPNKQVFDFVAEPIKDIYQVGAMPRPDGKTNTLTTVLKDNQIMEPVCVAERGRYIGDDGEVEQHKSDKKYPVYDVRNGLITIKGKQYPIKLQDGYYIIRKLTVRECMRLQTVPEWYEFPVSDSQAYKMLGNGWTCEVIAHLIRSALMED